MPPELESKVITSANSAPSPSPQDGEGSGNVAMLSASQLFCERDERILFENLDFTLHDGEVMQIQGSNGSGKTTLMRILCGLNDNYAGQILWYGEAIEESRESFLSSLEYIGHKTGVNKVLNPRDNLHWSCALHSPVASAEILVALERVGLAGFEDTPCHMLSAGQQQRVALARLLLSCARLWVLDEPFTTLDMHGVKDLESLLMEHVAEGGAVLVTTHHKLSLSCELEKINLDT